MTVAVTTTIERTDLESTGVLQRHPLGGGATTTARCAADWRRSDSYWVCVRSRGHQGRHALRRAIAPDRAAPSEPRRGGTVS